MKLKPYPEYKDSGVPWLEEIPAHWRISPGFGAYRQKQFKNTGMVETTVLSLSYGRIVIKPPEKLHGLVPASFETYQVVDLGDIVVRPTDLQNDWNSLRVGLAKNRGIITSAYLCLKATGLLTSEYAYYVLHAYDLKKIFYGMGSGLRQNLDFKDLKRMPVPVPSFNEQSAIVRFLDHQDRLIRRFIRAKRRIIELLNEQKQAIINQVVTQGLDPNVPLKHSGVDWLGEVPEHWKVTALRIRYSVELGKMLDSKQITGNYLVPYLRNTDVQWDRVDCTDLPMMDIKPDEYERFTVRPGDMLVCEGGDVGRTAFWNGALPLCGYQKALHRVRPFDQSLEFPRFLYYLMYTASKLGVFVADGSENTIAHLTGEKLRRHRFVFPPRDEQERIANYLDQESARIEATIDRVQREIYLIREYRERLITDVVTGKLDVRHLTARLPAALETLEEFAEEDAEPAITEGEELIEEEEIIDADD